MNFCVGILTVSDRCARGQANDESAPAIRRFLEENTPLFGFTSSVSFEVATVPDECDLIAEKLVEWSDVKRLPLILTTGGTGFAPRDVTPEATKSLLEKEAPGIVVRTT